MSILQNALNEWVAITLKAQGYPETAIAEKLIMRATQYGSPFFVHPLNGRNMSVALRKCAYRKIGVRYKFGDRLTIYGLKAEMLGALR